MAVLVAREARPEGGYVARITIDNAPKLNTINRALAVEIVETIKRFEDDSALRLVIEGNGLFPDRVQGMTGEVAARLGREYLTRVTPLAEGRARVVDKMPANFLYAGLIPLMLPGARIIHARRDPVDTCLSCYTKLFSGEQQFTYDQRELGTFYRRYERLMAHWREVLPPACFIEVDYEAVVDNLEDEARRLIDFMGLPWDDASKPWWTTWKTRRGG